MKISVIVPVYNVEPYLERCIQSILAQDFEEYEIVLVNDGTEDDSGKIAEDFARQYPEKIVYIKQENKGLGGARNTGILHAKGEYLLFVDSDDYIVPDTLQKVYRKMVEEQADLLLFDYYRISEQYEVLSRNYGCFGKVDTFTLETYPGVLFDNPSTWNKMYHRSLFVDYGIAFPDKVWYEDLRTTAKIYTKARKIVYFREPFYCYYQRESSIMHTKDCTKYLQIIEAMEDLLQYFKKEGMHDKFETELEFLAVYHLLFFAVVQVNKIDSGSIVQKKLREYVTEKFPCYKKNVYYQLKFSKKEKMILHLIGKGWFRLLRVCFDTSKFIKCMRGKILKKRRSSALY